MENEIDRTLELLWRRTLGTPRGSRGPKQRVSVDEVVSAGIAVADEDGLPAFSMRKVADRLGLKLMSIYTYVPGREELIGLMVDEVMGERPLPAHEGALRERLTAMARYAWEEYHRHPWLLQADLSRPWIGPNGSDRWEWQLAAIEGEGFTLFLRRIFSGGQGDVHFIAAAAFAAARSRRIDQDAPHRDEFLEKDLQALPACVAHAAS